MYKKIVISIVLGMRLLAFAYLLMSIDTFAQKYTDVAVNNRVILNKGDYIIYAEIAQSRSSGEIGDDIFYYWYSANEVKRTQGGYDGKLLHGKYTEFYADKDLKVQGRFSHGVKAGKWKIWHANGNISEIQVWSSSGRRAKFELYDENGNLIKWGSYRNEKLHGIVKEIAAQKTIKRKYRGGIEVIKVKKSKSDSTLDKSRERRRKFSLFKIKRHKRDSLINDDRKHKKIPPQNNVEAGKNRRAQKNEKTSKDTSNAAFKGGDSLTQGSKTSDSKKVKRRKKSKTSVTNTPIEK